MKPNDALLLISHYGSSLTRRQLAILKMMRDQDVELVYERGSGYVDLERLGGRTLHALLKACAISPEMGSEPGKYEIYTINSTGLDILKAAKL